MSATQRSNMRLGKAIRGFVLPAAIFLLVVLAALGAAIVTVSTTQQIGSALDVQGTRAYQAARAGIEWGLYQVQSTSGYGFSHGCLGTDTGSQCPNRRSCANASGSFTFATAPTLAGFTVTVSCVRTPIDDTPANNPYKSPAVYTVTSTACNAAPCPNSSPNSFYVERQMAVTF